MRRETSVVLFVAASVAIFLTGCRSESQPEQVQRHQLRGEVVAVDQDRHQVTLAHEKIEGFMDAMTMPFNVKDEWAIPLLAPGKRVQETLVVQRTPSWIEGLIITEGKASTDTSLVFTMPEPGATRCPLPDYCPWMCFNYASIQKRLESMPPSEKIPHLLTVSFDSEYDTPAVLRKFAQRYMNPLDFQSWEFATGSWDEIRKITGHFGLIFRKEKNQIVHSLVTALIGPDGRLVKIYLHNDWKPEEVLSQLDLE
ncbi:MAG: copper-binding protein [Acidobacteriota bacterium]